MPLALIGGSVSPFVRKVRVFRAEKGIACELEPLNPFPPPEGFRGISPLARIPMLRDGDRRVHSGRHSRPASRTIFGKRQSLIND